MTRARPLLSCLWLGTFVAVASGCVGDRGNPSKVEDLRVLGISLESPELMSPSCDPSSAESLATVATPIRFRALLADPKGEGRALAYDVYACAQSSRRTSEPDGPSDHSCLDPALSVHLTSGSTGPGELETVLTPGLELLADGTPLLQRTLELDPYQGLGGIRLPLQLRVRAGDEEVRAEKLMVYSCQFFPEMKANLTPELDALTLDRAPWGVDDVPVLSPSFPVKLRAEDFSAREEDYVVPSFRLEPVALKESWKLSWLTSLGQITPLTTGGTGLDGVEAPHVVEWLPPEERVDAQDVTFWVVVRDGRGGTSWTTRRARYVP